jgi:peptide chain release factor subunit 1
MVDDTLKGLELGAVETLIVWEGLETMRYVVRDNSTGEEKVVHVGKEQYANGATGDNTHLRDAKTGRELEVVDKISLVEWFADNYTKFGTQLEFVTNRSQEGNQFCKGFGGVGGLLRWKVDFAEHSEETYTGLDGESDEEGGHDDDYEDADPF